MNNQYYRITAYHPKEDIGLIMDSYGYHDKLWQFSSFMIGIGFTVMEVSTADKFLDGNITKANYDKNAIILRAHMIGKPELISYEHNGVTYKAVKVAEKVYVPDKGARHD